MRPLLSSVLLALCATACASPLGIAPAAAQPCDAGGWQDPQTPDDQQLRDRLLSELGALCESGGTATVGALKAQLDRAHCALSLPPVATHPGTPTDVHAAASDAVVIVAKRYLCDKCTHWHLGTASGFFVSTDGAFVTSRHVIDGRPDTGLAIMDRHGVVHAVTEVLAANRGDDVVILRAACDAAVAALPLRGDVGVGEPVCVLSHPASTYWYFSSGVVSRRFLRSGPNGLAGELLDITADFARGSSGAPVLDASGNAVGVVRATRSIYYEEDGGEQHNLQMVMKHCVPAARVRALVE
ncbi:MAG: trypsin-like peptidase domain-containing protein [Planctomycetes bacterium]|nr:trypsin-like peptidase domain-containing protein [Planctomycetota bacterium]